MEAAIGSPLAVVGEAGEDISSLIPKDDPEPVASEESSDEKETPTGVGKPSSEEEIAHEEVDHQLQVASADPIISNSGSSRVVASPLAKKMAQDKGIDLSIIPGSGDGGRIIKKDVETFEPSVSTKASAATNSENYVRSTFMGVESSEDVTMTQMRKVIASRLSASKFSAPHFYLTMEINMDRAIAARVSVNEVSPKIYYLQTSPQVLPSRLVWQQQHQYVCADASASYLLTSSH